MFKSNKSYIFDFCKIAFVLFYEAIFIMIYIYCIILMNVVVCCYIDKTKQNKIKRYS